jgi:hypothetical protein
MKGSNPLKYATAAGAFSNYLGSRNQKAREIRSEMATKTSTPSYYDEAIIDNKMREEMNNRSEAAVASSGGSASALRAMQVANNSSTNELKSDSYSKMFEINNAVRNADQTETQRISDINTNQRNADYQANLQEQDFVQGRKEKARDNMYETLGAIGQEDSDRNMIYNLSGGYKQTGYDPEDKTGWKARAQRGIDSITDKMNRNKKSDGGMYDLVQAYQQKVEANKNINNDLISQYNG